MLSNTFSQFLLDSTQIICTSHIHMHTQYDAVVIGAGWAGIRATQELIESNIDSILVLEAASYIGGRAKSINSDGSTNNPNTDSSNIPYDTGCEWLYNTGNDMEETLSDGGYLEGVLDSDGDTVIPLDNDGAQFYQQIKDKISGEVRTKVLTDKDVEEWMDEIWGGFLQYRENRLDELDGVSYGGESIFHVRCVRYIYVTSLLHISY